MSEAPSASDVADMGLNLRPGTCAALAADGDSTVAAPSPTLWALLDLLDDAVVAVGEDGRIRHLNSAVADVFGPGAESLVGEPLEVLVPERARCVHAAHVAGFVASGEQLRRMSARASVRGRRTDGDEFPAEVSICRVDQDGEILLLAFVRDVSAQHDLSRRVDWLALHDPVTGLANRAGMVELLTGRLCAPIGSAEAEAGRGILVGAVLIVDVEGFGFINHAHGTAVGDRVLQTVGQRLCGFDDHGAPHVARLGDDEFALHLSDVVDDATLHDVAGRLVAHLERPVVLDDRVIEVRVAVGARPSSFRSTTAEEALTDAAAALADGRLRGGKELVTFDEQVRRRAADRVHTLSARWVAIERGELHLVYQPIVDAWSGRPRSAEALLRWTHPTLGEVSPAEFVPLAEQTDLIEELGRWVLHQAAHQVARWEDEPWFGPDFRVAVNLSARQLRGRTVVDDLRASLRCASIPSTRLRVEVTETAAMNDLSHGIDVLTDLTSLGVALALDDFGTGHSSLARLGRLPIDEIKIDRCFVADVDREPAARGIVDAGLAIAEVFGIGVVAEGVERREQLDELLAMGCTLIQGWWVARAERANEFAATAARLHRAALANGHPAGGTRSADHVVGFVPG